MVHVAKYVIWNIILATVLLTLGAGYEFRFFISLILVSMIAVTLSVKVVIGVAYMLAYKCGNSCMEKKEPKLNQESRIGSIINHYEEEIRDEIETILKGVKEEIMNRDNQGSLVRAMRSPNNVRKAYKIQNDKFEKKSAVIKEGLSARKSARTSHRPEVKPMKKPEDKIFRTAQPLDGLFLTAQGNETQNRLMN